MLDFAWSEIGWFVPILITLGASYWTLSSGRTEIPIGYGALVPALRRTTALTVSLVAWAIFLVIHTA